MNVQMPLYSLPEALIRGALIFCIVAGWVGFVVVMARALAKWWLS